MMQMSSSFLPRRWPLAALLPPLFWLAGCGGSPRIPGDAPVTHTAPGAAAIFNACLAAHGGRAAYARLHDVNVRFDSHWATVGPGLQPVLSDRGYRQGSEERYLPSKKGFIVGQEHHGPRGEKHVYRVPPDDVTVSYRPAIKPKNLTPDKPTQVPGDAEQQAAAGLVTDAYAMFLWGPWFFVQRGATFEKLGATADINGFPCDELLTTLHPGLGPTPEDKVILFIGQGDHLLHRVQFTLNALESTRGAEVHLDLLNQQRLAGVMWPTHYIERIDRPVNLPAHEWSLLGFDTNRGYMAADLVAPGFTGRAAAPAATRVE